MIIVSSFFFFFNDTATTEIYTLSLHDALPICDRVRGRGRRVQRDVYHHRRPDDVHLPVHGGGERAGRVRRRRSEEHTSELQSRQYLVCRLLLEKKKKKKHYTNDKNPTIGRNTN